MEPTKNIHEVFSRGTFNKRPALVEFETLFWIRYKY